MNNPWILGMVVILKILKKIIFVNLKCGIIYHICGNIVLQMWYTIPHLWYTKIFLGGIWRLKPMPKIQESFLHLESKRIFLKFLLEKKIPKIVFILSHLYTTKVVEYTTYVVLYATNVVSYKTFVVYKKSKWLLCFGMKEYL